MLISIIVSPHISIHALRKEGDTSAPRAAGTTRNFYPRPPQGGRRLQLQDRRLQLGISIHALRKEGDRPYRCSAAGSGISIHALRKEGDQRTGAP